MSAQDLNNADVK